MTEYNAYTDKYPVPYVSNMATMAYETAELADEEPAGPSVWVPLSCALAGALLGGWITDAFPLPGDDQRTKITKSQKLTAAFLASGFVGLLVGMAQR